MVEDKTFPEMAEALLWGRLDAVIYNDAFDGIIEETVEDYADNVRILYQYGIDTEIKQEETDIAKPFNVYISGIDVSGPITTNSRSDVNIIMTVNPTTKKILLTTTPRDFYVPIPGISGDQRDKLTQAGIYGVDTSMATLEALYNIDTVSYTHLRKIQRDVIFVVRLMTLACALAVLMLSFANTVKAIIRKVPVPGP